MITMPFGHRHLPANYSAQDKPIRLWSPVVPPSPLSWHLDAYRTLSIMTVRGGLDAASSPALHHAAESCLENGPVALIMDLSAMTVLEDDAMAVFAEIIRVAGWWPGTPVLLCAPDPVHPGLRTLAAGVPPTVFGSIGGAWDALDAGKHDPPITEQLLPAAGEARRARDLATEACLRWGLPHLAGHAALIAGELVTDAVEHARTVMTLQFKLGWHYLYVAVAEDSAAPPVIVRAGRANGLLGVESLAHQWGYIQRAAGKVVWAALPRSPMTPTTPG
jgi:anti-anti-sigma regulatory factor